MQDTGSIVLLVGTQLIMNVPIIRCHVVHLQPIELIWAQWVYFVDEVPALTALAIGDGAGADITHNIVMQGEICGDKRVEIERCFAIFQEREERVVCWLGRVIYVEEQGQDTDTWDAHCMGPEFLLWAVVIQLNLRHDEFASRGRSVGQL